MTGADKEQELYSRYLDALTEHTWPASELRASELRLPQNGDDSASAKVDRASLMWAEQNASQRYLDARKAYQDYMQASAESDQ